MKKYYVTLMFRGDEQVEMKTDNLNEAVAKARYFAERNNQVEIRVYKEDVEDEDCACFDYDTVEF